MKYKAVPCDDGRWFIYDTEMDVVFAYVGNELTARKTARILNQTPEDPLTNSDNTDSANLHWQQLSYII